MLINRLIERLRRTGLRHRELGRRARAEVGRPPVILVPSVLGVDLVDEAGRAVWGATHRLFAGASFADVEARPGGVVDGFDLVPRIYRRDVFGGLIRYLDDVGDHCPGEDLFVLSYDWRRPLAEGALALARLVARVRGASDTAIDLVAISSGGAVARAFLAGAWPGGPADRDGGAEDAVLDGTPVAIRRVVYLGAPQRGSVSAFDYTQGGVRLFAAGKQYAARSLQAGCPSLFDLLPPADERLFVDAAGRTLDHDHLDPAAWRALGLVGHDRPGLTADLARARRLHETIAAAGGHPPSVVIAGRGALTAARAIVADGAVAVPCPRCGDDKARYPFAFAPGDGTLVATSTAPAPGQGPDGPWWIEPRAHDRIATDAFVHPLVLEALLAPSRPLARERYAWPRSPATRGVVPPEEHEVPDRSIAEGPPRARRDGGEDPVPRVAL